MHCTHSARGEVWMYAVGMQRISIPLGDLYMASLPLHLRSRVSFFNRYALPSLFQ